jgi:hypothetical protein
MGWMLTLRKPTPPPEPVKPAVVAPPPVAVAPRPVEPKPVKPAGPIKHDISITSTPADADVWNGPEKLGTTPLSLQLTETTTKMNLVIKKKGFKDQPLEVVPDRPHEFVLTLLPTSHHSSSPSRPSVRLPAAPPAPAEAKPEPKSEPKPAGKLRDLKDPFAN